jgi:hypothetical protein
MSPFLRLYPRAWRQRYGEEVQAMLETERPSVRLAVDLIAGAIDARMNPQWRPAHATGGDHKGGKPMSSLFRFCEIEGVTREDQWKSATLMIGGTVILVAIYIALKRSVGENAVVEAFGISAFPIALTLSMHGTYFKRYSGPAKGIMIGFTIVAVFAIVLLATLIGNRL